MPTHEKPLILQDFPPLYQALNFWNHHACISTFVEQPIGMLSLWNDAANWSQARFDKPWEQQESDFQIRLELQYAKRLLWIIFYPITVKETLHNPALKVLKWNPFVASKWWLINLVDTLIRKVIWILLGFYPLNSQEVLPLLSVFE